MEEDRNKLPNKEDCNHLFPKASWHIYDKFRMTKFSSKSCQPFKKSLNIRTININLWQDKSLITFDLKTLIAYFLFTFLIRVQPACITWSKMTGLLQFTQISTSKQWGIWWTVSTFENSKSVIFKNAPAFYISSHFQYISKCWITIIFQQGDQQQFRLNAKWVYLLCYQYNLGKPCWSIKVTQIMGPALSRLTKLYYTDCRV